MKRKEQYSLHTPSLSTRAQTYRTYVVQEFSSAEVQKTLLAKMLLSSCCRSHLQGINWKATANVPCTTLEQRLRRFLPLQLDSGWIYWVFLAECGFELSLYCIAYRPFQEFCWTLKQVALLNYRNKIHFVLLIVPKGRLYVLSWSDFLPSQSRCQNYTVHHSLWQGAPRCYLCPLETDPHLHRSTK